MRQGAQHFHGEPGIGIQVGSNHLQQEVGIAGNRVAGDDRVEPRDAVGEFLGLLVAVAADPHPGEGEHPEPDLAPVEHSPVAANHASFFQRPHPAPAGRSRHADIFRQRLIGQPPVGLQRAEDADVGRFEGLGHE